jgi:hypothetical protein
MMNGVKITSIVEKYSLHVFIKNLKNITIIFLIFFITAQNAY